MLIFQQFHQIFSSFQNIVYSYIFKVLSACSVFIFQINAEFIRVTTVPLETKFLAQLDKHSHKLLEVIRSKGGRVKEQTTRTLQVLDEVSIYELAISGIHSSIVNCV